MVAEPEVDPSGGEELDARTAALRLLVAVLEFASELAMLGLLAYAGWHLGGGGLLGISLGVLYPCIALLVWAVWLAPRSRDRLDDPGRLMVQIVLFAGTAAVVALADHITTGIVFAFVAVSAFVAERFLPPLVDHAGSSPE